MKNVISWFQIPVTNMDRAIQFYNTVFGITLNQAEALSAKIAIFPYDRELDGVSGALYMGAGYEPSEKGTLIILNAGEDLLPVLSKVESAGGKIIMQKTGIGNNNGFIAKFIDSEGNKIGLRSTH